MGTKQFKSRKQALLSYIATGQGTPPTKLYSMEEQLLREIGDRIKALSEGESYVAATKEKLGAVKMSSTVASVSAANAPSITGTSADEDINKIGALSNANKTAINAILTALKNAGIMSSN